MVYYFTSNVVDPPGFIYVGKDKIERYGRCPSFYGDPKLIYNIKFHVDKLSSAHIYLRLAEGQSWDSIPAELLTDCAQLTKANSIEGNKKDNQTVIYTPWDNLKKDGSMAVGQVGFKDQKRVKRVLVAQRENPVVNRLNKTKKEEYPDLRAEKEGHLQKLRAKDRIAHQARKKEEAKVAKERKEKAWQRDHAYDDLFTDESVAQASNQESNKNLEDDFW